MLPEKKKHTPKHEVVGPSQVTKTNWREEECADLHDKCVTFLFLLLTPSLLHFFDAELGRCHGRGMMGWGVVFKQELAPSEDGAHSVLRRLADLEERNQGQGNDEGVTIPLSRGLRSLYCIRCSEP